MVLVEPDFSQTQDKVAPGTYRVNIRSSKVEEWASGDKYVNWELETFGEPEPRNNGRRLFLKTDLGGKWSDRLKELYLCATGEMLMGKFDTDQLHGRKIEVRAVDGMKHGEPTGYLEIRSIRPLKG